MEVRITARHAEVPDDVREYAEDKFGALSKFDRHTRSIEVVLGADHIAKTVEVIAHLHRGAPVVVSAAHEEPRAAIDVAHGKLETALRRHKERMDDRRRGRTDPAPEEIAESAVDAGGLGGEE